MGKKDGIFNRAIESSEMACSLLFEDVRGCPYNKFTARDIAVLCSSTTVLAFISLLVAF